MPVKSYAKERTKMKMHFERNPYAKQTIYNLYKFIVYVQKQLSVLNRDEE